MPGAGDVQEATKAAILRSLESQRRHVLGSLEGLTDEQLLVPMLPSGWSCLSLVQHLTIDVEHYWFACVIGGDPIEDVPEEEGQPNGGWRLARDASSEGILDGYRRAIDRANEVITAMPLDAPPRQRDPWWGDWSVPDHRFVLLHVITETACHAGHLDAARELLDGRQWLTL